MNMIRHMKDKAKKITVVFMAALLCLFSMPGVAMADEGGTWVPFVNDGLFNPGTLSYSHDDSGLSTYYCLYMPSDGIEYSLTLSDVNRYRIRLGIDGNFLDWIEVSPFEDIVQGFSVYLFEFNIDGVEFLLTATVYDGSQFAAVITCESGVIGETNIEVFLESFISNSGPTVSSFLDSGTSVLTWLISTFSSILTFMIANPICFIGLIGSLVGVAFIYIKSTIGT